MYWTDLSISIQAKCWVIPAIKTDFDILCSTADWKLLRWPHGKKKHISTVFSQTWWITKTLGHTPHHIASSKDFEEFRGVGWVTLKYRKMLWGPLRGDGQTFQGGGLVSLRLPGFEKADHSVSPLSCPKTFHCEDHNPLNSNQSSSSAECISCIKR